MKIQVVVPLIIFVWSIRAFGGAASSGGGTGVRVNDDSYVLFDLVEHHPSFEDTYKDPRNRELRSLIEQADIRLLQSRLYYGIPANMKSEHGFELALSALEKWRRNSPSLVNTLRSLMDRTHFLISIRDLPRDSDTPAIEEDSVPLAFVTDQQRASVFIDIRYWPRLGDTSKAGLFIHEQLRRMQVEYKFPFSDADIRMITSTLLLESPEKPKQLDSIPVVAAQELNLLKLYDPIEYACRILYGLRTRQSLHKLDKLYTRQCLSKPSKDPLTRLQDFTADLDALWMIEHLESQEDKAEYLELYKFLKRSLWGLIAEQLRPIGAPIPISE